MIQIRGPHTLRGICRRRREDLFTADGFYSTGDLGRLDDDGFLFYHGRSDDMFKVSGATVYPTEVEQALRDIDGLAEAERDYFEATGRTPEPLTPIVISYGGVPWEARAAP